MKYFIVGFLLNSYLLLFFSIKKQLGSFHFYFGDIVRLSKGNRKVAGLEKLRARCRSGVLRSRKHLGCARFFGGAYFTL